MPTAIRAKRGCGQVGLRSTGHLGSNRRASTRHTSAWAGATAAVAATVVFVAFRCCSVGLASVAVAFATSNILTAFLVTGDIPVVL